MTLPSGEDPDTYARKAGREGIERHLGEALDVFERKIQLLERGGWFADLHRRRRAIDHLLPSVRAASDPVTRDMYLGRAAEATGVDRRVLAVEADAVQGRAGGREDVRHPVPDAGGSGARPGPSGRAAGSRGPLAGRPASPPSENWSGSC